MSRYQPIPMLDILRGFALFGILFPNMIELLSAYYRNSPDLDAIWTGANLIFRGRFFPIFAVVFGVSFFLFIQKSDAKGLSGRGLQSRRLRWLLVLGIPHQLIHPGEALLPFSIFGFLLLALYRQPLLVLLLVGLFFIVLGVLYESILITTGLIFIGAILGKVGYFENAEKFRWMTLSVWILSGALLIPLVNLQFENWPSVNFGLHTSLAGLNMATFFVTSIVLMPHAEKIFKPLVASGKMALTYYVLHTLIILAIAEIHPLTMHDVLLVWASISIGTIVVSNLWIRYFVTGPLEWLWRWVTYQKRPPFRRKATAEGGR